MSDVLTLLGGELAYGPEPKWTNCRYCADETTKCSNETWVYQIHDGRDVIYVGMTTREPITRITEHGRGWENYTWQASLYPCEWEGRDNETRLINYYNPRHNTLRPTDMIYRILPPVLQVAVTEPGTALWPS